MTACGAPGVVELQVYTVSAPAAKFAAFRTFAFRAAKFPPDGPGARRPRVQRRMRSLIAARLMLRGYVEKTGRAQPDLVISFDAEPGALVVDAFDARTDASVWRGAVGAARDPGPEPACLDDLQLRDEVKRVLASFPARADGDARAEVAGLTW